ncbi:MAG: hypothetical protein HOB18_10975 [Nitrospina sp.]|jgi:hypothetical protein|nr:hypothetical protein [Nitrospina sp.]
MEQKFFIVKNNQYSVVCYKRVAEDCYENGGWCASQEEAQDWVEDECWIFSGEGWFCPKCNIHFMQNLSCHRRDLKQEANEGKNKANDGLDHDLTIGIDPL